MTMSLDPSQKIVATASRNERQIVIAAPGSGKTHTAIELIKNIDSSLDYADEHQIVYISFSNTAIGAAIEESKLALEGIDLVVDAGTLDSFANAIVREHGLDFDRSKTMFEDRIAAAIDIIDSGKSSYFEDTVHMIIDEAQDIYGIRRELALQIIDSLPVDCGVTILGDPMQSIYEFLINSSSKTESAGDSEFSLIEFTLQNWQVKPRTLAGQYRALTPNLTRIHENLRSIQNNTENSERIRTIERTLSKLPVIDKENLGFWAKKWGPNTAILTRTNAQVLVLADALSRVGVTASPLLIPEERLQFPPWISAWAEEVGSDPFAPTALHEFLSSYDRKSLEDVASTGYDLTLPWKESTISDLATYFLRRPAYATTLLEQELPLVSTIHQSKGRQFDTVVLVNPFDLLSAEGRFPAEPELAYVGITRSRKFLQSLNWKFPKTRNSFGSVRRSGIVSYRRSSPNAIEVRPSDVDRETLYGESLGQSILKTLPKNARLELSLVNKNSVVPRYRLQFNEATVGVTTEKFGQMISSVTRTEPGSWPHLGSVLHDGTETVFGNETIQGKPCWLVPRPVGFASIFFN